MGEVRVPSRHRGLTYRGRGVRVREESLLYHLAKRVDEPQWAEGTTGEEYLKGLRSAAHDQSARLVLYTPRAAPSPPSSRITRSPKSAAPCLSGWVPRRNLDARYLPGS
ncbi:MAG: hypothetical protein M3Q49_16095 [Actinomycetota bacterium]|nr:hypothetical protein [Actinomycetota bacterium]